MLKKELFFSSFMGEHSYFIIYYNTRRFLMNCPLFCLFVQLQIKSIFQEKKNLTCVICKSIFHHRDKYSCKKKKGKKQLHYNAQLEILMPDMSN